MARAVVALVIHVILRGDPTGSRRTRERGGVGLETIPNKKRATEAQTAEKQRVPCPSGGRGSGTGPRMSEARGGCKTTASEVRVPQDLVTSSTCAAVVSSFAAPGCWFGGVLLLVAVVEVMLSNSGKRWNLARHSQRFWQLVACDLGCFL